MKKIVSYIFLLAVVTGCRKENSSEFFPYSNNELNDTNWYSVVPSSARVRELPVIFARIPASDSVNASTGGFITVIDSFGTARLYFPPAFCTLPGTITSVQGKVKVEVRMLASKGDMVRAQRPTMSYDKLLVTGGALMIKVTANGQVLQMAPNAAVTIQLFSKMSRNSQSQDMRLFYGKDDAFPASAVQNFTWIPSTDTLNRASLVRDTTFQSWGYQVTTRRFGWVNVDHFADTTQARTKLKVTLPPNFTNVNTNVFAVMTSPDIVAELAADNQTKSFNINNIQTGRVVTIVTLSYFDGRLFMGAKTVTIAPNMTVSILPEQKTKEQINNFLDNL